MEQEPERIELLYFVRYRDPITKKRITTSWRMTEAEAAERFAGQEYEILRQAKEERRIGGDPLKSSMGRFYKNQDGE